MRQVKMIGTAVLLLIFGVSVFGYAQRDHQDGNRGKSDKQAQPAQQHAQQQQQNRASRQQAQRQQQNRASRQHAQQQQQNRASRQQAQRQQQNRASQQHAQQQQQNRGSRQQAQRQANRPVQQRRTRQQQVVQQREQRDGWAQHRARNFNSEHRTWQQRGGYNGYRIPDVYFRSNYGRNNFFRIYGLPFMMVGGYGRFQYGGYWFSPVDPYPEYWGNDWYQTDDMYINYVDGGYYMYNRRYPGRPGIAISISF